MAGVTAAALARALRRRVAAAGQSQQCLVQRRLDPDDLGEKLKTIAPGFRDNSIRRA